MVNIGGFFAGIGGIFAAFFVNAVFYAVLFLVGYFVIKKAVRNAIVEADIEIVKRKRRFFEFHGGAENAEDTSQGEVF